MKKLLIGVGILTVALLTGCDGYETGDLVKDGSFKAVGDKGDFDILRDLETGCLYLEPQSELGLVPFYDENGKIMGCGEKKMDLSKYE